MKRKDLIKQIEIEAYVTGKADVRLFVENRISRSAFNEAVCNGIKLREDHLETGKFPDLSSEAAKKRALASIGVNCVSD